MLNKILILSLLATISTTTKAEFITCKNVKLSIVGVQGDRDDSHPFNNKLIIQLKNSSNATIQCGGKNYIHLDNTESATYNSLLSIALSAYAAKLNVNVSVNTSSQTDDSNKLSVITLIN